MESGNLGVFHGHPTMDSQECQHKVRNYISRHTLIGNYMGSIYHLSKQVLGRALWELSQENWLPGTRTASQAKSSVSEKKMVLELLWITAKLGKISPDHKKMSHFCPCNLAERICSLVRNLGPTSSGFGGKPEAFEGLLYIYSSCLKHSQ